MGTPQLRHFTCVVLLRRARARLQRITLPALPARPTITLVMDARLLLQRPHRVGQHGIMVTSGVGLPARVRLVRWQRLGYRVQRQPVHAHDLPRARHGRQRRELGPFGCSRSHRAERRRWWTAGQALRHRRLRQPSEDLGLQRRDLELRDRVDPTLPAQRLGPRCRVEPNPTLEIVHCQR